MTDRPFRFPRFRKRFSLKLAGIILNLVLVHTPQVILAQGILQRAQTTLDPLPSRTQVSHCPVQGQPLTALVPSNGFGITATAYPTFFVYVPARSDQVSPLEVEFVVKDTQGNEIYQSGFNITGQPGIITLRLPTDGGLSPLAVGEVYQWSFSMLCQAGDSRTPIVVNGMIKRVSLDPALEQQLAQATPEQQAEIYATAGIWQDALAVLVQLRRDRPNDPTVTAQWLQLLDEAGLRDIAPAPVIFNSQTP